MPANIQDQAGKGPEQPDLFQDVPFHYGAWTP